jgi:hypothetical protein
LHTQFRRADVFTFWLALRTLYLQTYAQILPRSALKFCRRPSHEFERRCRHPMSGLSGQESFCLKSQTITSDPRNAGVVRVLYVHWLSGPSPFCWRHVKNSAPAGHLKHMIHVSHNVVLQRKLCWWSDVFFNLNRDARLILWGFIQLWRFWVLQAFFVCQGQFLSIKASPYINRPLYSG